MNTDTEPPMARRADTSNRLSRLLRFPLTRIVILAVAVVAVRLLPEIAAHRLGVRHDSGSWLLLALLMIVALITVYRGGVRLLEQRSAVELGGAGAVRSLAAGIVIGSALFCAVILVLVTVGAAAISAGAGYAGLLYAFTGALLAAVFEELLMRGVLFRIVEEWLGSWISLAFTAALFGALHGLNRGATFTSSIAVALEAGVLLAAAYMCTRRLWWPIGLHLGWNFTEGGIFGAAVSGGSRPGLLHSSFHGPELLTGGPFGPEASVIAVIVSLALATVFVVLALRAGDVKPPPWRTRGPQPVAA